MAKVKKLEKLYEEALAEEQGTHMLLQSPGLDEDQFNNLLRKYGVALAKKFKIKKLLAEIRASLEP